MSRLQLVHSAQGASPPARAEGAGASGARPRSASLSLVPGAGGRYRRRGGSGELPAWAAVFIAMLAVAAALLIGSAGLRSQLVGRSGASIRAAAPAAEQGPGASNLKE